MVKAIDHDFKPDQGLRPFGRFVPDYDERYQDSAPSGLTAEFSGDCLQDFWSLVQTSFTQVTTLLINLDNGPENHARRPPFLQRLVGFADAFRLTVQLAYSPPYHSQYTPVERVWGVLEPHWKGALLDSGQTVLRMASTMTYNGLSPVVKFSDPIDQTGVRVSPLNMAQLEDRFERHPVLGKWVVRLAPHACA